MPMIGRTLLHYEVTARIGAGGMGEVYRATDTKLGREVAIKILPEQVAKDPERLARFQREAQLLAALNHPNIAAIHGLEEADGTPFLALELVPGEDLSGRLERGPLPVDEALEIARQVAEALEEAHARGIVHRDLKPANVKVTPEGRVKVLDFGLAKAYEGDAAAGGPSSAELSQSPTLAQSGTLAGMILGTAAYMAPEQASGKAVDKRADIWSFGAVLFEMLTGARIFTGETTSEILASVIKDEPSWKALPSGLPPAALRLLRRCLRKRPRERLQDIGDARLELEEILAGEGAEDLPAGSEAMELRRLARQRSLSAWGGLVAASVAAALAVLLFSETDEPPPATHFVIEGPELQFHGIPQASPDGRSVAFTYTERAGPPLLAIRRLDSLEILELPGAGVVRGSPFWSFDGEWVAVASGSGLKKVNVLDGTVQTICAAPSGLAGSGLAGGTWNAEGTIVFETNNSLYSVSAAGGEAELLAGARVSGSDASYGAPSFLPDGRHLLFTVSRAVSALEEEAGVYVSPIDALDRRRRVLEGNLRVTYAAGYLLFVRDGVLLAQAFDTRSLEVSGEVVVLADDADDDFRTGWRAFSASPTQLSFLESRGEAGVQLTWVDRKGEALGTLGEPGDYGQFALSPDERRVAVEVRDEQGVDLWTIDVARGVASRLTSELGNELDPVWSPDSQELAYGSDRGGEHFVFRKGLRGAPAVPVAAARGTDDASRDRPEAWSPDGKLLLCKKLNGTVVWALPLEGGGDPEPVLELEHRLDEPALSPDGRWLACTSEESGTWEVYVQPFRRAGERIRVSADGGGQPEWRGDGKELFFQSGRRVMAVDVEERAGRLEVGLPKALFQVAPGAPWTDNFAVSADGQRFLVKVGVAQDSPSRIHVVTSWTSLLKR